MDPRQAEDTEMTIDEKALAGAHSAYYAAEKHDDATDDSCLRAAIEAYLSALPPASKSKHLHASGELRAAADRYWAARGNKSKIDAVYVKGDGYLRFEWGDGGETGSFHVRISDVLSGPAAPSPATAEGCRDRRQTVVAEWCAAAFGTGQASSVPQRGIRLLEEAIEAYQACGCDPAMAHKMVDFVFGRPTGTIRQELGGVGVTTLALASAAGISAEDAEADEVARVLAKPLAYFTARNQKKNDEGFAATPTQEG